MNGVRLSRDTIAAGLLTLGGLGVAVYATAHYGIGTLRMIGPGAFPIGVGVLLALTGILIGLSAYLRPETDAWSVAIKWGDLIRTSVSLLAFASLIRPMGAVPAILALSLISMATRDPRTWSQAMVVSVLIGAATIALFQYGLGLRFAAFRWPL